LKGAEEFIGARKLRNLLVHEYMTEVTLFLEALLASDAATQMLMNVVSRVKEQANMLGLFTR